MPARYRIAHNTYYNNNNTSMGIFYTNCLHLIDSYTYTKCLNGTSIGYLKQEIAHITKSRQTQIGAHRRTHTHTHTQNTWNKPNLV